METKQIIKDASVKPGAYSGGQWRARKLNKGARASRETGRKKGLVPPTWAKACAKQARSYKNHPRYEDWCAKCTGDKVKWGNA